MTNAVKYTIVTLSLLLFTAQSVNSLRQKSATFDEVQYFGIGKYLLLNHKWDVMGAILHPPLTYYLTSLPLLFVTQDDSVWQYEEQRQRDIDFLGAVDYYRGQKLLSAEENRHDRLLIASRCMIVLLGVLLGWYVYRFSSELYGVKAGLLSLFLYSLCPNMLAYSGVIVPDFPLTVFTFVFIYHYRSLLSQDTTWNRWLAALSLGLALLSKFTAILLIPVLLAIGVMQSGQKSGRLFKNLAFLLVVSCVVVLIGYQLDPIPLIQGIQYQFGHASDGHAGFLLGHYAHHGWWYYYLIAGLLKTPLPVLILAAVAFTMVVKQRLRRESPEWFLILPIVTVVGFFSVMGQSIGLRYILPVYPFAFVLIGAVHQERSRTPPWIYLLMIWFATSSLVASPHYLAYFSELVGGPGNGYRYLADSNLDWGQDLPGLKRFMDRNGIEKVSLSYFGADAPERYGIVYDWLPSYYLYNPNPERPVAISENQLIAISVTNLQGVYFQDKGQYKWLMDYEPVAKIGYSIYVYDLSGKRDYKL